MVLKIVLNCWILLVTSSLMGQALFRISPELDSNSERAYRYVDISGAVVIPGPFCIATSFHNGLAATARICENPQRNQAHADIAVTFINSKGENIFTIKADMYFDSPEPVLSSGRINVSLNDKCGYLDEKGKIAIPFDFESCRSFENGLAYVGRGGRVFFIDPAGKEISPFEFKFDYFDGCSEGLCLFRLKDSFFYYDTKQKQKLPGKFKSAGLFSKGLAPVAKSKKWGFINKRGKILIPAKYEYANRFSEGLALVKAKNNSEWYFIDKKGRRVHPGFFESAWPFQSGLFFGRRPKGPNCYFNHEFKPVVCETSIK